MNDVHEYMMGVARAVEAGANCVRASVGVVVAREGQILATGFNETPAGIAECKAGGCTRCAEVGGAAAPANDDRCLCIHGEVNAVASAARAGIALDGATIYTTKQPCPGCAKTLVQAGVVKVFYQQPTPSWLDYGGDYSLLEARLDMEHLASSE